MTVCALVKVKTEFKCKIALLKFREPHGVRNTIV